MGTKEKIKLLRKQVRDLKREVRLLRALDKISASVIRDMHASMKKK